MKRKLGWAFIVFLAPSYAAAPNDNRELARIYAADQSERNDLSQLSTEKIEAMIRHDAEHRSTVLRLLQNHELKTGLDYERAAMIFQHTPEPDDKLVAHLLATVAVSLGDKDALWISAASLDRYLQESGKPQVFGTQFNGSDLSQEPFSRDLIDDEMRRIFGVPPRSEQTRTMKKHASPITAAKTRWDTLPEGFPVTAADEPDPVDPAIRVARGRNFSGGGPLLDNLSLKPPAQVVTSIDRNLPELPVRESMMVVVADVEGRRALLSADWRMVYTEYQLKVSEELKPCSACGREPDGRLAMDELGGAVRRSDGYVVRSVMANGFELPEAGKRYVFFLMYDKDAHVYGMMKCFELRHGVVVPMPPVDSQGKVKTSSYSGMAEIEFKEAILVSVR